MKVAKTFTQVPATATALRACGATLRTVEHLALLGILFLLFLIIKGLDRLEQTLESLRDDYRKVNNLNERERSEIDAQL
jgi:hypothetical protein